MSPAAPPPAPGGAGSCTLGFVSPPRILAFTPSVFSRHTQLPLDKILAEKWRLSHSFVVDLGALLQGQDPGQPSSPSPAGKALRPHAARATKPEPTKADRWPQPDHVEECPLTMQEAVGGAGQGFILPRRPHVARTLAEGPVAQTRCRQRERPASWCRQ